METQTPPDAGRVLRRVWVLSCVAARGFVEGDDDVLGRERVRREVLAWMAALPLGDEVEPGERAALDAAIGALDRQRTIDCGWRSEGIVVLVWALGLGAIGPIDREIEDPRELVDAARYLEDDAAALLADVRLRPLAELERYAEDAMHVHRRLRDFVDGHPPYDCGNLFAASAARPLPDVAPIVLVDDDLAIDGRALRDAEPDAVRTTLSIAIERQRAASWLLGQELCYGDVTLDT